MDKSTFKNFYIKKLRRKEGLIFAEEPISYKNIFKLSIENIYNLHVLHYLYQFNLFRGKIIKILLDGRKEQINFAIIRNFIRNHSMVDMFILNLYETYSVEIKDLSLFFSHQFENKILKMIRKNNIRLIFDGAEFTFKFNMKSNLIYDLPVKNIPIDAYKYLELLLRDFNLPDNFPDHPISVFFLENKKTYLGHTSPFVIAYSLQLLDLNEIVKFITENKIRIEKNDLQNRILEGKVLEGFNTEKLDLLIKSEYLEMRVLAAKIIKRLYGKSVPKKYSTFILNSYCREIRQIFTDEADSVKSNQSLEENMTRLIASFDLREINYLYKIIKKQIQENYSRLSMDYLIEIFNGTIRKENITYHKSRAVGYLWYIRAICEERFPRFELYRYIFSSIEKGNYPYVMFNVLKFLTHNHFFDFILNEKYLLDICFKYFNDFKFIIGEILGFAGMQLSYFPSSYFNYMVDEERTFIILSFADIYIEHLFKYGRENVHMFSNEMSKYTFTGNCFIDRKYKNILKKIHGYLSSHTEYRTYVEGKEDQGDTPIYQ